MNKLLIAVILMLLTLVNAEHPNTCYFGFCAAGGACNETTDGGLSNGKIQRALPSSGRIHCWCFKSDLDCASSNGANGGLLCPALKNLGYTGITASSKGTYFWYSSDQGYGRGEADCTSSALASISSAYPELSGTKSCTTTDCNSPFSYVTSF